MDENWLTAIFNNYLAGVANAILGLVNLKANDPAHPWETWLVMELLVFVILILLVAAVRPHFSADRPGRLQHLFETIYDFLKNQASEVGIEHPDKYVDFFGSLFIFILAMNLIGIIPGFESPTMSIYVPAGLAICTWVYYHAMGIRELGWRYLAQFAGPVAALIWLMVPIELIGHVARMLSLTVRLYGNMFAGEQVFLVFLHLVPIGIPMIFLGLHLFVAFLQTYIFMLMTLIYLGGAAHHDDTSEMGEEHHA